VSRGGIHDGPEGPRDEPPPFGGSWAALYAIVIAALAGCIAALAWLSGSGR
jgi:hypothetical protein